MFANYFGFDDQAKQKLWDDCIFVFDTNVLTSLYKRSDEAREALLKIIETLGERVWIPHQVIYEFLRNRPSIVHEQSCMYAESTKKLSDFLAELESNTKHPFLDSQLHRNFVEVSCRVISALEDKAKYYEDRVVRDDVKERLADLLEGKVGDAYDENKLKELLKFGEGRYANHIPPGYEDAGKYKNSTVFEHVRARYGDLIVWRQLIDYAKAHSSSIILITGDQKDDWWLRVGGKTLSPRPELISEFKAEAGADFYMYSHSNFLSLANDYLHQRTSASVIKEIEDAALEVEVSNDDVLDLPWEQPSSPKSLDQILMQQEVLRGQLAATSTSIKALKKLIATSNSSSLVSRLKDRCNHKESEMAYLMQQLAECANEIDSMRRSSLDSLV
ncbi:PIN domain-containing protein [Pseudomonas sp. TWI628]|uniref:PIN domain-containing protein n=1 Tax=Pseudomonas sp. TWI628 TaxID=3136788 RepID=UPI00320794BE